MFSFIVYEKGWNSDKNSIYVKKNVCLQSFQRWVMQQTAYSSFSYIFSNVYYRLNTPDKAWLMKFLSANHSLIWIGWSYYRFYPACSVLTHRKKSPIELEFLMGFFSNFTYLSLSEILLFIMFFQPITYK